MTLTIRTIACCLLLSLATDVAVAAEWDPNDATFDPNVQSVVIGNRTWLGDPSPFLHLGSSRTGYTHVNATKYENFDPSIVISLMVPLKVGETKPPGGGMLMLSHAQAAELIKRTKILLDADAKQKDSRFQIETALADAVWHAERSKDKQGNATIRLENKIDDSRQLYQFSTNAMKKLLEAINHSLKK